MSSLSTSERREIRLHRLIRFGTVILFACLLASGGARAQPKGPPTTGDLLKNPTTGEEAADQFSSMSDEPTMPVERSVDPDHYRVGPNDRLIISSSTRAMSFPVTVGLDNSLVLPRGMPPIDVTGMTLADVESTVDSVFSERSAGWGDVRLSLGQPRTIYVTVGGNVTSPGRYILTSADRVTTAIDAASKVPEELASIDDQLLEMSKKEILGGKSQYGSRNLGVQTESGSLIRTVVVRRADGSAITADLIRYQAYGIDRDNPTLMEGDRVIVEFPDPFEGTVSIAGAVHNPVLSIPYREGDRVRLLLRLAAGFRHDAIPDQSVVVRSSQSGETEIPIDLTDSSSVRSFSLEPGDQIIVPSEPRKQNRRSGIVTVVGEVVQPQAYAITPGATKLTELISRAGGFTALASLNGAYVRRKDDPLSLRREQQVLDPISGISTSPLNLEDTTRFAFDQQLQRNLVSADFKAIFEEGDMSKDVILQDGDEIIVPRERGNVYVSGRVNHPGAVTFREGEDFEFYIAQAGGYTSAAAPDRTVVRKFGSGVYDGVCCTEIESGDEIYVAGERDTPARTPLEQASTILAITASLFLIIDTIINIVNKLTPDEG